VDVRCRGCQAETSEWAGWCATCGRSLEDAVPVGVAPRPPPATTERETDELVMTPPGGSASGRATRWPSRRRTVLTAVAAAAAAAAIVATAFTRGHSSSSSERPKVSSLPAGLARERLFFAEPGRTGIYEANGTEVATFPNLAGSGYPNQPLVSGKGVAVYLHAGEAYRVAASGTRAPQRIGPAVSIFPADRGDVGIEADSGDEGATVYYMAANGVVSQRGTAVSRLPPGVTAVARLDDGLLVASAPDASTGDSRLSVIEPHATVVLGTATSVIGTSGTIVAWQACARATCALRLVDTAAPSNLKDVTETIRPPHGYSGFAAGGGFSPDGSLLAAFVTVSSPSGAPGPRLVLIRTHTGVTSIVGRPLAFGESVGSADWSADGQWLYFGGLSGVLYAERTSGTGTLGRAWALPLKTSYVVAGL
jgi:hypothetical protein